MNSSNNAFSEGQSIVRPPMFNGNDYAYWKVRMGIYLSSVDYDVWDIIETGYKSPTITVGDTEIPKPKDRWDANDKKLKTTNAKAMNALICALDKNEFNRISHCTTAQEIWHTLEVTHEGTSQVKESRLALFSNEYENFVMDKGESIKDMFGRFSTLVYNARALGKVFTEVELVRKVLRVLPMNFEAKVTAIQESKDLSKLSMEELIGNLMTYELELKAKEERNNSEPKKKTIALKSKEESDEEDPIEELAMAVNNLRRWSRFKPRKKKTKGNRSKDSENSDNELTCYNCNKPGHIKPKCPLLKNNKEKKKAKKVFAATWDDEEGEEVSNNSSEEANLCLMAKSDSEASSEESSEAGEYSYRDLVFMCLDLTKVVDALESKIEKLKSDRRELVHENFRLETELENIQNLDCKKCKTLDSEISRLKNSFENLEKENLSLKETIDTRKKDFINRCTSLVTENTTLKTKVQNLEKSLNNFSRGEKSFNMLLGNQIFANNRKGLGFGKTQVDDNAKGKSVFARCEIIGHRVENCSHRNKNTKFIQVWVPKNSTNKFHVYWNKNKRTKQVWVPKGFFIHNASATNNHGPIKTNRSQKSFIV